MLVHLDKFFGWDVFFANAPIGWLSQPALILPSLFLWGFPWIGAVGVLIYLAGLQSIGQEVYEAAELDGVGPKVLPPGVFGKPQFSSSGSRIAWTAERLPAGTDAVGYWPKAGGAASMSSEPRVLDGKFALSDARTTGEALLVHSSVLVVWDWRTDELAVITPESVLPAGSLPREGVAIAAHPIFDGSDSGLIFGCHLLPPWRPGLSACLNRPTKLFHLSEPLHAARLSKAPANAPANAPAAAPAAAAAATTAPARDSNVRSLRARGSRLDRWCRGNKLGLNPILRGSAIDSCASH
jgi:hypothetical protein